MTHNGPEQAAPSKKRWVARLRHFFNKAGAIGKAEKTLKDPNLANAHDLLALDRSLSLGLGDGLRRFVADAPCLPLAPGCIRYFVQTADLPQHVAKASLDRTQRSCLRMADGSTKLEVEWSKPRSILHVWMDMGSVGWPSRHAVFGAWHTRGTFNDDPAHRRWDNCLRAIDQAQLTIIKLEVTL